MKRFWIGVALLLVLFVLGVSITASAGDVHSNISDRLSQAVAAAMEEDWDRAQSFTVDALAAWTRSRKATASIADHEPMEEIDSLFSQICIYLTLREQADFSAYCARLSVLVEAVGEAHSVSWWNLL